MRRLAPWLALMAAATALAAEPDPACRGARLIDTDGGAGRVDACLVQQALDRAELRARLLPCVEQMLEQPRRVFGGLRFSFLLGDSGAATDLRLEPSAFDQTTLPRCFSRELRRAFTATGSDEQKVRLEGKLFIPGDHPLEFGLDLSAPLQPPPEPPPALPGGFVNRGDGFEAECRLEDDSLLKLLLASEAPSYAPDRTQADLPRPVSACREQFDQLAANQTRAARRGIFRNACRCLSALLSSPQPELRVSAAEELMSAGCWGERRKLFHMLRREFGLPQRAAQEEPPLQNPAGDAGRLRLVRALIDSGGRLPQGAMERLVADASPQVRYRILQDILVRRPSLFAPVADYFLDEKDALLAARAANLGCLLGQHKALVTFERLLSDRGEGTAVLALLHAPACLRATAALDEPATGRPLPTLLRRRIRPANGGGDEAERLVKWLGHPCPIVRFLAGEEMARRGDVPQEAILPLLERERDENLKERLAAMAEGRPLPSWPIIQLWLENIPPPTP